MDTNKRQNRLVDQGLAQIHTGLGILLGTGFISNGTHQQILALINNVDSDETTVTTPENQKSELKDPLPGYPVLFRDTLSSIRSRDFSSEFGNLNLADEATRSPAKWSSHRKQPSDSTRHQSHGNIPHASPTAKGQTRIQTGGQTIVETGGHTGSQAKIICPWYSTSGYHCRNHDAGKCPYYHDDILDGLKDPLICCFWADGHRCTKSDKDCKFAHYVAQHRQIAPLPIFKGKTKKSRVATGAGSSSLDWRTDPTLFQENNGNW